MLVIHDDGVVMLDRERDDEAVSKMEILFN